MPQEPAEGTQKESKRAPRAPKENPEEPNKHQRATKSTPSEAKQAPKSTQQEAKRAIESPKAKCAIPIPDDNDENRAPAEAPVRFSMPEKRRGGNLPRGGAVDPLCKEKSPPGGQIRHVAKCMRNIYTV